MRQLKYISLLLALVGVVSCAKYDIDTPALNKDNTIQVVGRVRPYSNINVGTKANDKVGDEGNTVCMCLVVIGTDNKCKRKEFSPSSHPTFTIDKSSLDDGDMLYIFANIPNPDLGVGDDLEKFLKITNKVSGITEIPEFNYDYTYNDNGQNTTVKIKGPCLPMIGSMVISDVENLDPILPIGLESVYAKIVVNILSKPDQKVDGISPASFSLSGFEVKNVAGKVDFKGGTESTPDEFGDNDNVEILTDTFQGKYITSDFAQSDRQASFYFYLPERFLHPSTPANSYDYPFGRIADLDDDEKQKFPQRYKPVLAEGLDATYVTFYGEYIDHQGHNWNVSYDIYLGNDNYSNFDIIRNTQYTNTITIKGISTSNDHTNNNSISIDHRVDIERVSPIIVNLRRETLLDSHFEVRPLRIRMNNGFKGQNLQGAKVVMEVIYNDDDPAKNDLSKRWIGLERSFGNGEIKNSSDTYLVASDFNETKKNLNKKNSAGKRKYFTSDLTTNTLSADEGTLSDGYSISGGQKVIVPIDDQCIWIYIDECNETGDDIRSAIIRVTSIDNNGEILGTPIDYMINQRLLFPVTYSGRNYHIEYHEEYLHNYDAEDSYGQTEYEGMQWGLEGIQLSDNITAILVSKGSWNTANEIIAEALSPYSPKYDYYLTRDVVKEKWSYAPGMNYENLVHDYNGYEFNRKIITKANIGKLDLGVDPGSAVEYCYNKNKRDENGNVTAENLVWYLPAIDEIEEIVMSQYGNDLENFSYSRFVDFRAKKYWSCQPAYYKNYIFVERWTGDRYGEYMIDNTERARATSVRYSNDSGNGPSDPNNYFKIPSGSNGYYKYVNSTYTDYIIGGYISNTDEYSVTGEEKFSGTNNAESWNHTLSKSTYDEGALYRNDYARVRCVRIVNP